MRTILILLCCTPALADGWVFTDPPPAVREGCGCGKGGPYVECRCRLDEIAKLEARIAELEKALAKLNPAAETAETTGEDWRFEGSDAEYREHLVRDHGVPRSQTAGLTRSQMDKLHTERHVTEGVTEKPKPVVAIIGASWCPPCQGAKRLAEQSGTPYVYLDVDDPTQRATAEKTYGFRGGSIPFVVKLDANGRPTSRTTGFNSIARRWCEGK